MRTRVLLSLGLVLLFGGLALGFLPRSYGGVNCGSAFRGYSDNAVVKDYARAKMGPNDEVSIDTLEAYVNGCRTARDHGRIPVFVLAVAGVGLLAAGASGVVRNRVTAPGPG